MMQQIEFGFSLFRAFAIAARPSLRIIPSPARASTCLAGALLAAACHHPTPPSPSPGATAGPVTTQVLPLDQLYLLEVTGVPPGDTALSIKAGAARTVILRHGAPDNNDFAELEFPATVFAGRDSVHIEVHPRPGIYGVDFSCDAPLGAGARIRFEYPVHFSAPLGAQQRYGGPVLFERVLAIAQLREDGRYALLASSRPTADNLEAPLSAAGTYIVAAPK